MSYSPDFPTRDIFDAQITAFELKGAYFNFFGKELFPLCYIYIAEKNEATKDIILLDFKQMKILITILIREMEVTNYCTKSFYISIKCKCRQIKTWLDSGKILMFSCYNRDWRIFRDYRAKLGISNASCHSLSTIATYHHHHHHH